MSSITSLTDALSTEFGATTVVFSASIPTTFTAPSVVVAPATDAFLSPGDFGMIKEAWDVLVVVSFKEKATGLAQMREMSLRVRKVVSSLGALWERASGPLAREGESNRDFVLSLNRVTFQYDPSVITDPTPPPPP